MKTKMFCIQTPRRRPVKFCDCGFSNSKRTYQIFTSRNTKKEANIPLFKEQKISLGYRVKYLWFE